MFEGIGIRIVLVDTASVCPLATKRPRLSSWILMTDISLNPLVLLRGTSVYVFMKTSLIPIIPPLTVPTQILSCLSL